MVDKVAESKQISKRAAREEIDNFIGMIFDALETDGMVKLGDRGTLKITHRAARVCKNPQDRTQEIQVPAKLVVVFSQSSVTEARMENLKTTQDAVNS